MTSFEYLLNKFPVHFQQKHEEKCRCGHGTICTIYTYNLIIDVTGGTDYKGKWHTRYRMYFKGTNGYNHKQIGPIGGIGFLTLKEALKELMKYKTEIRGVKEKEE